MKLEYFLLRRFIKYQSSGKFNIIYLDIRAPHGGDNVSNTLTSGRAYKDEIYDDNCPSLNE